MRIVVVGDLQNDTFENVSRVAKQIEGLCADYIVTVGDYGNWSGFGTYDSFKEIADAFAGANSCELIPLLGNHDIQYESGEFKYAPGTVFKNYEKAFGFAPENRFIDIYDEKNLCARLFCIHLTPQSKNEYVFFHECHVDDADFAEVKLFAAQNPEVPVIIVTHAPPAGAEMLCVPSVHIRAGNAYMDQDHDIYRWAKLAEENRNIVLWLCGHYHVGHRHEKSTNVKDGVTYMIVGSPVCASRDGQKHTRVIDINDGQIEVFTFDHTLDKLCDVPDAQIPLKKRLPHGEYNDMGAMFCVAEGKVLKGGIKQGVNGRLYIHTDNGILWEVDIENRFTLGSLHYSEKYELISFKLTEKEIYRFVRHRESGEMLVFSQRLDDAFRFMREFDYEKCNTTPVDSSIVQSLSEKLACGFSADSDATCFLSRIGCRYKFVNDSEGLLWIQPI